MNLLKEVARVAGIQPEGMDDKKLVEEVGVSFVKTVLDRKTSRFDR